MTTCPFCGADNIEGSDLCDQCQHSLTDVGLPHPASAVEKGLLNDRVDALRPRKPSTVLPSAPIGEVLKKMVDEAIGCVLVVDEQHRLVGIFSERDAMLRVNDQAARMADKPVSSVMTPNPTTLRLRDKIAFALQRMNVGGYRHLPILDEGKLVGVVSIRDILAYLTARHHASS